jgi:hypothetical protein
VGKIEQKKPPSLVTPDPSGGLSLENVVQLAEETITKHLYLDRTAKIDHNLANRRAVAVSTSVLADQPLGISVLSILKQPLKLACQTPVVAPGFASVFQGSSGWVVFQTAQPIILESLGIDHIHYSLCKNPLSAPKEISVSVDNIS